jgi:hypothetical protein
VLPFFHAAPYPVTSPIAIRKSLFASAGCCSHRLMRCEQQWFTRTAAPSKLTMPSPNPSRPVVSAGGVTTYVSTRAVASKNGPHFTFPVGASHAPPSEIVPTVHPAGGLSSAAYTATSGAGPTSIDTVTPYPGT